MISRFSRRGLCFFLALVTLCMCLSPALTQPAEAVAAVDDAAILSLALLFTTWAGVTFTTSSDAVSATNQYLGSKPAVKASLAGVITKGLLVEGTKLLLTHDIKAAYEGFVTGIFDFYRTDADSLSGVVADGLTAGASFSPPYLSGTFSDIYEIAPSLCVYPVTSTFYGSISATVNGVLKTSVCSFNNKSSGISFYGLGKSINLTSNATSYGFYIANYEDLKYASLCFCYFNGAVQTFELARYCTAASISVETANPTNTYDFERSATVDGSQALSELGSASDDDTRSIDIGAVSGAVSSGLAGATTVPGLTPEEWVEILKKALYIPGTGAEVIPTEVPDVTDATDPSEDPGEDPDTPYVPPEVFKWMEEHKQSVQEGFERLGDRLQQLQDGILPKIEAFQDTVTQGFINCQNWLQGLGESIASALDALGSKLSAGVQSLFDTLHEFATQTFPAKMAEVGQWIQSLPEKIAEAFKKLLPQQEDLGSAHPADWKTIFPFCVPFDLIEFLGVLNAEPEAPVIHWRFYVPRIVDYDIEIDLSVFDGVAQIMRTMELLAFCIGLILLTRNIIRG